MTAPSTIPETLDSGEREESLGWFDRMLGWAAGDDPGTELAKIRGFEVILLFHLAATMWNRALILEGWTWEVWLRAAFFTAVPAGALWVPFRRIGMALLAAYLFLYLLSTLPLTSNHLFLEFLLPAVVASFNFRKEEEQRLFLSAMRWLLVIVIFYSGVQKLYHGYYFRGELLAYFIAVSENFRFFFGFLLPEAEVARLAGYSAFAVGDGPYRVDSLLFIFASNIAYAGEIVGAGLLLWRRTRALGAVVTGFLVLMIELGARELIFGALFVNLLLLAPSRPVNRRLVPVFAVFYAVLLVLRALDIRRFAFN